MRGTSCSWADASRIARLASVIVLAAGLTGCASSLPPPTAAQVQAAQEREPAASLADLTRGRDLYVQKCGNCHALRDPAGMNREQWDHAIHEMRTEQNVKLTEAEHQDILRYLDAASRAPAR
ncbi:MAG TPA: hypothetical protein VFQ61_33095 [Polyangiaceae bacterium]|nr:hypothetical protein [Polyangiaceae bacterium]